MKNDKTTKPALSSAITAVCYVVTLLTVVGVAFLLTKIMFVELGRHVKLIYPPVFNSSVQAQNSRGADEAAIRQNVRQMEDGWNTKSGALFAKPFAEDADYVVINGQYLKGRTTLATAHQEIFDTIYKDTTVKLTVKNIRFLRPDVAVVHVEARRDGPTPELRAQALLTLIMTRERGNWSIAAFQNTKIQPQR